MPWPVATTLREERHAVQWPCPAACAFTVPLAPPNWAFSHDKKRKSPPETPSETPSFEQSLARLEEIVHSLEEGELGLSERWAATKKG